MGGYVRIDKDLVSDQRLFHVADRLASHWRLTQVRGMAGEDLPETVTRHALRHAIVGVLVTLWVYADTYIKSDDSVTVTLAGLATIVNLPVEILQMLPETWLRVREDGTVQLPNYCAKNHIRARDLRHADAEEKRDRKRELAAERQRRRRRKQRGNSHAPSRANNGVTPPRDSNAVTHDTGTGTGPLDRTQYRDPVKSAATPPPVAQAAPAPPRKTFEQEFAARFGVSPDEAAAMRSKPGGWKG